MHKMPVTFANDFAMSSVYSLRDKATTGSNHGMQLLAYIIFIIHIFIIDQGRCATACYCHQ